MARRNFLAFLLAGVSAWAAARSHAAPVASSDAQRVRAADILSSALKEAMQSGVEPQRQRALFHEAVDRAAACLSGESAVVEKLKEAIVEGDHDEVRSQREIADRLRTAVEQARQDLLFQPIVEAETPKGFPKPTPVGEIEVKQYPAYRKAQADRSGNTAFWTLFAHIQRRGVPMTAPVEIAYRQLPGGPSQQTMAFLYRDLQTGQTGDDGSVSVVDVPAASMVSTGVRGWQSAEAVGAALKRLESWLEDHKDNWRAAGAMRVMGFNSPFVPRERNFFEVEIPVEKVGD